MIRQPADLATKQQGRLTASPVFVLFYVTLVFSVFSDLAKIMSVSL